MEEEPARRNPGRTRTWRRGGDPEESKSTLSPRQAYSSQGWTLSAMAWVLRQQEAATLSRSSNKQRTEEAKGGKHKAGSASRLGRHYQRGRARTDAQGTATEQRGMEPEKGWEDWRRQTAGANKSPRRAKQRGRNGGEGRTLTTTRAAGVGGTGARGEAGEREQKKETKETNGKREA